MHSQPRHQMEVNDQLHAPAPGTYWIVIWVVPRVCLHAVMNRKKIAFPSSPYPSTRVYPKVSGLNR